jgi:hypothetical protein
VTYDVQTPGVARLWPYIPNWSSGFDVTRSFLTDINVSRDGTEQRRALRTEPRISAAYRTVVSGADRRAATQHLLEWQNSPVAVPDFARWARLTASAAAGTSTLTIDPLPAWAAADQLLVLCGTGSDLEMVRVASVLGNDITTDDPLVGSWGNGSVIRPAFFGLFSGEMASSRMNRDAAEFSVEVRSYPGGEPPRATGTAWDTFNSKEVFTLMPDYASPPSLTHVWPVEQIDYGRGRTAEFRPIEVPSRRLEVEFSGQDATATAEIEQFFDRHLGRRNAFYMPTWEADLVLAQNASGTTIRVTGDLTTLETLDAIAVCLTDGTQLYRSLSNAALISGNTQFTVSSSWPVTLTASNVARISWMPLWRFASDEMTASWRTPRAANVHLGVQQVTG